MKATFLKVKSNTTPGKFYTVRILPDLSVRCSCPAFVFREKCRHSTKIEKGIEKWKSYRKSTSK